MWKLIFIFVVVCTLNVNGQLPVTHSFLQGPGFKIPQYSFDSLAPLLNPQNDTTYIINFWATWCIPCVQELPNFEKITDSFKNAPVKVVLVSLDMKNNVAQSLPSFIQRKGIHSCVVYLHPDGSAWIDAVDKSWDGSLPVTVICSRQKRLFINGTVDYPTLKSKLNLFIKP
jgi:thiol-disulfide isomerase/thioredoxin